MLSYESLEGIYDYQILRNKIKYFYLNEFVVYLSLSELLFLQSNKPAQVLSRQTSGAVTRMDIKSLSYWFRVI